MMSKRGYYKQIHKLLEAWKAENNITKRCVVHHRDDTEETRRYNEKYYYRWGFNEDDTFEYGKYVVFMTMTDHLQYHNSGDKNAMKRPEVKAKMAATIKSRPCGFTGKHHTEEARQKMSESRKGENGSFYGKKHSEETLQHLREACALKTRNDALLYHKYKANGGELPWNVFRKLFHNNDPQVMQYLIN